MKNYSESSKNTSQWNETINSSFENDIVNIQVQDETGMWKTTATSQMIPEVYLARMREAANMHPGKRVRTANSFGRVIDLL